MTQISGNESAKIQALLAQPDGEFHWTPKQKKALAEFENGLPELSKYYPEREPFLKEAYLGAVELALFKEAKALCAGGGFNEEEWSRLLTEGANDIEKNRQYSILETIFYVFKEGYRCHFCDILSLYALVLDMFGYVTVYFNSIMSLYFNADNADNADEKEVIEHGKILMQKYHSKQLPQLLKFLSPNDFQLASDSEMIHFNDEKLISYFAHNPTMYATTYQNSTQGKYSEPELLYAIHQQKTQALETLSKTFNSNNMLSSSTAKIQTKSHGSARRHLKSFSQYQHVDVLDFMITWANETEVVSKFLTDWVASYPIFTLKRLIERLDSDTPHFTSVFKNCYAECYDLGENLHHTAVEGVISSTLTSHPEWVTVLKNQLDEKHYDKLSELTKHLTDDEIAKAYESWLSAKDVEEKPKASKAKTEKSTKPKKLTFPTFLLTRITDDDYHVVFYQLNDFNTKTKKNEMHNYYGKYPQTVLNEIVFLLFSKQTEALLKKAKTSAKVFWDWLIENDKEKLVATLKTYDAQLKMPKLVDFLSDYEAQKKFILQSEAELLIVADLSVGADGIPSILLNDDWRIATGRRSFDLPSHINIALPELVLASTKQLLPRDAFERLLQMLFVSTFDKPTPNLLLTLQYFTKHSQRILADAMWDKYLELRLPYKEKWLLSASGYLYHDELDDKIWQFIKEIECNVPYRASLNHSFAVLAEQAISRQLVAEDDTSAGDSALRMLIRISQKARASLRPTADEQLERYAKAVGLCADDLADQLIPTLGLDAQGKREFDFGERQFIMRLDAEIKPIFTDNNGKTFKNLPKAGAKDDADKAQIAHDNVKNVKKALKAFKQDYVPRLENLLINQLRLPFKGFKALYIDNPLMLRFSSQLIWGLFDEENSTRLQQSFRIVETGEIIDINDDELSVSDDVFIGMVHPVQLTQAQLSTLETSLQDDEIMQPIMQLARPAYTANEAEKSAGKLSRFEGEKFATGSFLGLYNKGWGVIQDSGYCYGLSKKFSPTVTFAILLNEGYYLGDGVPENDEGQTLEPVNICNMDDIAISELIYLIDSMARR